MEGYSKNDKIICKICGRKFKHLGSHIYHKHGLKANDYKEKFGLPHNFALISREVKKKKQEAYLKHYKKYTDNLFTTKALKNRFKGGKSQGKTYFSRYSKEIATKNIKSHNKSRKWKKCPVCNKKYKHLDSHLFNKHKLVRV